MPIQVSGAPFEVADGHDLSRLFGSVFNSFSRSDQRRWAQFYVTGLVSVPGRKSIPRMAEALSGDATTGSVVQCVQQFVNQSPWAWQPVRRSLVDVTAPAVQPTAWVAQEVEFVKDGRNSVGVCSQFAPALRRVVNCQMATLIWMVGAGGWVPADWRLMVPRVWDADAERRTKARLPESEHHRPSWEMLLESIDEITSAWTGRTLPLVADRCHDEHNLAPLVAGLRERNIPFLLRLGAGTAISTDGRTGARVSADQILRATQDIIPLPVPAGHGSRCATRIAHAEIPTSHSVTPGGRQPERPHRLLALLPPVGPRPRVVWYTNLSPRAAVELLGSLDIDRSGARELARLREGCGLDHFEGRSFRGWHHHVTLASVAHARSVLTGANRGPRSLRLAR